MGSVWMDRFPHVHILHSVSSLALLFSSRLSIPSYRCYSLTISIPFSIVHISQLYPSLSQVWRVVVNKDREVVKRMMKTKSEDTTPDYGALRRERDRKVVSIPEPDRTEHRTEANRAESGLDRTGLDPAQMFHRAIC